MALLKRILEALFGRSGECRVCGAKCEGRHCTDCLGALNEL